MWLQLPCGEKPPPWDRGIFFAYKIAGAKADTRASLDEVKATVDKVIEIPALWAWR